MRSTVIALNYTLCGGARRWITDVTDPYTGFNRLA